MFCYTPSPSRTLSPSSFYLARPGDACPVHPSIHSLREGCTIVPAVLRSPGEHSNISHTALPHPRCNSTSWIVHSPQEPNILTRQFTKSSKNICLDRPELQGHVTLRWTYFSVRVYTTSRVGNRLEHVIWNFISALSKPPPEGVTRQSAKRFVGATRILCCIANARHMWPNKLSPLNGHWVQYRAMQAYLHK